MTAEFLNTLQELVDSACDQLHANRELITKPAVMKIVQMHGSWHEEELDQQLPGYINHWRLNNLELESSSHDAEQIAKYKAELVLAKQTINKLKAERVAMIKELRGLLDG